MAVGYHAVEGNVNDSSDNRSTIYDISFKIPRF